MTYTKKPKYIRPLHFIESGFINIKATVNDLVKSSNLLLKKGAYAHALSLSVIALEECGKIFILDSLLFARDKNQNFYKKSSISHKDKLDAFQFSITLLNLISKMDTRYLNEKTNHKFSLAVTIGLKNLHDKYKEIRDNLPDEDFRVLDIYKQKGFYSHESDNNYTTPFESVDKDLSVQINQLANLFLKNMKFIMNEQAVNDYITFAKRIRGNLSEDEWVKINRNANRMVTALTQ